MNIVKTVFKKEVQDLVLRSCFTPDDLIMCVLSPPT